MADSSEQTMVDYGTRLAIPSVQNYFSPQIEVDNFSNGLKLSLQNISNNVPIPTADPRGSNFIERLPSVPQKEMQPFGAGEIPTAALMRQRGFAIKPDRNVISPDAPLRMSDPIYRGYIQRDI
jgi:hypothetical protein